MAAAADTAPANPPPADRPFIWTCAVAVVLASGFGGFLGFFVRSGALTKPLSDFIVFWTAARFPMARIYDVQALTEAQRWYIPFLGQLRPFPYPPSFLPWIAPFGHMPFVLSGVLWVLLSAALYLAAARLLARGPAMLIAAATRPVLEAAFDGQSVLLAGAFLIGGVASLRKRPLLAGALLAVAATIKPQMTLMAPLVLISGRHWRAFGAAMATGLAIGAASLLTQGVDVWFAWIRMDRDLLPVLGTGDVLHFGVTPYLTGSPALTALGALLGVACAWIGGRSDKPHLTLAGLAVGALLCSPYALMYDLVTLVPAAAIMLLDRKAHPVVWLAAGLLLSGFGGAYAVLAFGVVLIWHAWPGVMDRGRKDQPRQPERVSL
ncbi:MAG TPA: glycosyltransferase family 87 protein [Caulobacteraceae bacterium]|jgi:hypothetical protein|nr:glycosyltransferase family 87 protein [Caulobacteraceae bacterium]